MIGLTAVRARREQQRLRTRQARQRMHWWEAQTRAAARRAVGSPIAMLAAVTCGYWVGMRGMHGRARVGRRAWFNWRSIRHSWLQVLRIWTLLRGVQMTLGIAPMGRHGIGTRQGRAHPDPDTSATPRSSAVYRDGQLDGL